MRSNSLSSAIVIAVIGIAPCVHAFVDPSQFLSGALPHAATLSASGEGIYFTGAPRFAGLDCASCHTEGSQRIGLRLDADEPSLFTDGYEPGRVYELVVRLRNEREGLDYGGDTCTEASGDFVPCNNNSFALEVDDALGPLAGQGVFCSRAPVDGVCPAADETTDEVFVAPDGDAVFGNRTHDSNDDHIVTRNGATSWRLWWTAPSVDTGPLKLYVSVVDGNGGLGTVADNQNPMGDDTVHGLIAIPELGGRNDLSASSGCSAASSSTDRLAPVLVIVALWLMRRRGSSITET